ncbi:glycosyltransferase [Moraxella oblonga]|uniref:glycosyltransferase n=1 Tax=Moraxella oblonga TaxID=200413 RepID=UPI0008350AD4|nr:glycosyltransferase [Moraxella oblonga]
MNIYINCSARSLMHGGYAEFSRGITAGLALSGANVFIRDDVYEKKSPSSKYNQLITNCQNIKKLTDISKQDIDFELVITSINNIPDVKNILPFGKKILITGSPFLGITHSNLEKIKDYNAVFYSGSVDEKNFLNILGFDLPQPVDIDRFNQGHSEIYLSKILNSIGFGVDNCLNLLFVGTFNYWKGVDVAIKSFILSDIKKDSTLLLKCGIYHRNTSLSYKEYKNFISHLELFISCINTYIEMCNCKGIFDLSFVSDGMYVIDLDFGIKSNFKKRIVLDMYQEYDISPFYSRSDVVLCPSRGETWSMPVVEAILHNKFVILSEHIGSSKYVASYSRAYIIPSHQQAFIDYNFDDRSSGGGRQYAEKGIYYFEPNIEKIASALTDISNIVNQSLPDNKEGSSLVMDKFSWEKIGKQYYDCLCTNKF